MRIPESVTELLQTLIRIPSVNPHGDPGVDSSGEGACAEYLRDLLSAMGANAWLQDVLPGRPNVIGAFPSDRTGKPRIVFGPHIDTVSVKGMTIDPFSGELRDGRVWGRGATDTKGPLASMLWAIYSMRNEIPTLPCEIWFAGFMGEEAGQDGSRAFAASYEAAFAMAGEATGLDVVHAHKGSIWYSIETTGRAVHASMPDKGENAIAKMVPILEYLQRELPLELPAYSDPILGAPTISVGTIHGGSKCNIVPDFCRIEVDFRTIPLDPRPLTRVADAIRRICPDVRIEESFSEALHTPIENPFVQKLLQAGAKPIGAPWFCDAAILSKAGIPAVAIGPGCMANAHTPDEWIAVQDLEEGVRFFQRFLRGLP